MAWISNLAGKAEDILNKIDQNAATVLSTSTTSDTTPNLNPNHTSNDEKETNDSVGLKKVFSTNSLTKSLSLTPVKTSENLLSDVSNPTSSLQLESNISSRKSSFSSSSKDILLTKRNDNEKYNIDFSAEKELAAFKIALSEIKAERDELKSELFQLQEELKHAAGEIRINELQLFVDDLTIERNDANKKLQDATEANTIYVKTISELETNLAKNRTNLIEAKENLERQTKEAEQKSTDLDQYRKKAQSTLQMKDRIIDKLKGSNSSNSESPEHNSVKDLQFELETLKQENLLKATEILELNGQLDQCKLLIENFQKEIRDKNYEGDKMHTFLTNNLKAEQEKSLQLEAELRLSNQEITVIRHEITRQRQSFAKEMHGKDQEIQNLKNKASEFNEMTDPNNIESRLQSLTQALFQKQTAIETVTAEKNALKLQLENVEGQLRTFINKNRQSRGQTIHINDTDDAKAQFPFMMRENPFDTRVARRVKRAYSSLDSAGIRVGVFLRRYPLVRIMVLMYIAVLHLWVIFVLFSSTPA